MEGELVILLLIRVSYHTMVWMKSMMI